MKKLLEKLNNLPLWEIACLIGGLMFLIFGSFAIATVIRIAGIVLIVFTVYQVIALLRLSGRNLWFPIKCFTALLELFVGIVLAVRPGEAISFVGLMAGLFLAFYSGAQLYRLFLMNPAGARDRILTGMNILCFLAGLFLIFFRGLLTDAISLILGIALLLEGGNGLYRYWQDAKRAREEEKKSGIIYADKFDDKSDQQ